MHGHHCAAKGLPETLPDMNERRHANRMRARHEYAVGATNLKARPRFLIVELTRKCNLSCEMCRPASYNRSAESMSDKVFEQVATELMPFADIVDLRGWGESLILPEFEDRLTRTLATGAQVRIVTNLSFQRPAVIDSLAAAGAYVGVSIDSADASALNALRRGARLDLIETNLTRLSAALARHGHDDKLCIYVTCQAPNLGQLAEIIDLAARNGVRDVRFAPVTVAPNSPLALPDDRFTLQAAFAEVSARAARLGVNASVTASPFNRAEGKLGGSACLHPWTHCYVTVDGRAGFCDHLIGPEGDPYIMGDLNVMSFDEIWNGPAWMALRETHVNTRDPKAPHFEECAWCYRNRYLDSEDLLEPAMQTERVDVTEIPWQ